MRVSGSLIELGIGLMALLGCCGCGLGGESYKIRFVLNGKKAQTIRAIPDRSVPLDLQHINVLRAKNGVVRIPVGLMDVEPPVFYDVVDIVDPSGRVLGVGNGPAPGQFGFLGEYGTSGGGKPTATVVPDKVTHYFKFGWEAVEAPPKSYPVPRPVHFRIIIPPGFRGEVTAVEDKRLPLDFSRIYDLKVIDGVAKFPRGYLRDYDGGSPIYKFDVVQVVDTDGRAIPMVTAGTRGEVVISNVVSRGVSVTNGKIDLSSQEFYFDVDTPPAQWQLSP